jgi:histidinol dehydrogenase
VLKRFFEPDRTEWREILRPAAAQIDLERLQVIMAMLEEMRLGGDAALRKYSLKFDGFAADSFLVPASLFDAAKERIAPKLADAIDTAIANLEKFHGLQKRVGYSLETGPGVSLQRAYRPISRVGLYVPGGTAPLFSSLLMMAVPALLAGCRDIAVFTPPAKDGCLNAALLYCASRLGISSIYRLGGVQAVAAMAFGSESIPAVDKIFGPGNSYVTLAKQLVGLYGVACDMPAGPSEIAVVASEDARADFIAADLLSQAEHGPDSGIFIFSDSEQLLDAVNVELTRQVATLSRRDLSLASLERGVAMKLATLDDSLAAANLLAPEHLVLTGREVEGRIEQVSSAGSVFIGKWTPETAGDYASGTNHVLPTLGQARGRGGLALEDFQKSISVQRLSAEGIRTLGPVLEILANEEGLPAHRAAVSIRLDCLKNDRSYPEGKNVQASV